MPMPVYINKILSNTFISMAAIPGSSGKSLVIQSRNLPKGPLSVGRVNRQFML